MAEQEEQRPDGQLDGRLAGGPSRIDPRIDPRLETLHLWDQISRRTYNAVMGYSPHCEPLFGAIAPEDVRLSHLSSLTVREVLRQNNLGRACYFELDIAMKRYGWDFQDGPPLQLGSSAAYERDMEAGRASARRDVEQRVRKSERQREMMRLHDEEKRPLAEIAERYGVMQETVKQAISEGRKIEARRAADPLPEP
jgi:hypothetical protein